MEREASWHVIASERLSLAHLLRGISESQWEMPSLCAEWRVRDVAAHVAMAPQFRTVPLLVDAIRARGSFDRLNQEVTARHARRPVTQIVRELEAYADSRRLPVVTSHRKILLDVLVHGQDIAIPLGLRREMPLDAARASADLAWSMGWPFRARRRLRGFQLRATDVTWSAGEGQEVAGPISALLLLMTGRVAVLPGLQTADPAAVAARFSTAGEAPDPHVADPPTTSS